MERPRLALTVLAALASEVAFGKDVSVYDWPDVLGRTWLFDQGSTYGFMPEQAPDGNGWAIRGPAPDWDLGNRIIPWLQLDLLLSEQDRDVAPSPLALNATQFPGQVVLNGSAQGLLVSVQLEFLRSDAVFLRVALKNVEGDAPISAGLRLRGSGAGLRAWGPQALAFALPPPPDGASCLRLRNFSGGHLLLGGAARVGGKEAPLQWAVRLDDDAGAFEADSSALQVAPGQQAVAYAGLLLAGAEEAPAFLAVLDDTYAAEDAFQLAESRWDMYLSLIVRSTAPADANLNWAAVKSLQTLLHNWRAIPGFSDGVLPSYTGYENGFWSWDTYKQIVGMVQFAPDLAISQLRLMAQVQEPSGHLPDKVDRCGNGGGCSGKPPLLSWAVWEVYAVTRNGTFLQEMYPVVEAFHRFWYAHRDVLGVGLCSWTEGMESGMDDGVRFMPQFAASHSNSSTGVTTLDFWSIDLNAYLYREKRVLAQMAATLGNASGAAHWQAEADALLPRLQALFFQSGRAPDEGFFQDVYFNGTALPVQGCEGYAALFAEVATLPQAVAMAKTLRDPSRFLSNFSLPTVSKLDANYNAHGYWRGPTWLDQSWFAYTGLMAYSRRADEAGDPRGRDLKDLAKEIKRRVFAVGRGFVSGDPAPLNEHYEVDTGEPQGATHFSWTAAHTLMWALEPSEIAPAAAGGELLVVA